MRRGHVSTGQGADGHANRCKCSASFAQPSGWLRHPGTQLRRVVTCASTLSCSPSLSSRVCRRASPSQATFRCTWAATAAASLGCPCGKRAAVRVAHCAVPGHPAHAHEHFAQRVRAGSRRSCAARSGERSGRLEEASKERYLIDVGALLDGLDDRVQVAVVHRAVQLHGTHQAARVRRHGDARRPPGARRRLMRSIDVGGDGAAPSGRA